MAKVITLAKYDDCLWQKRTPDLPYGTDCKIRINGDKVVAFKPMNNKGQKDKEGNPIHALVPAGDKEAKKPWTSLDMNTQVTLEVVG